MKRARPIPKKYHFPIVRQILGRIHVMVSNWKAIHEVRSSMQKGAWHKQSRAFRKWVLRYILKCHFENRKTYIEVMSGWNRTIVPTPGYHYHANTCSSSATTATPSSPLPTPLTSIATVPPASASPSPTQATSTSRPASE